MIKTVKIIIYKIIYILGYIFPIKKEKDSTAFLRLDALGDFILWIPMAQEYRKRHLQEKMVLVCSKINEQLAIESGVFDEVIVCQKWYINHIFKHPICFARECMKISRMNYNRLIVPVYSRTIEHGIASYLIKAKSKIAIDGDTTGMPCELNVKCNRLYDILVPTSEELQHELIRNAEFMSALCAEKILPRVADITGKEEPLIHEKYFVLMPGASIEWKCWNIDNFIRLSKRIQEEKGYTCVLCGNTDEILFYKKYIDAGMKRIINKIGKTDIHELINIIQNAEIFIGNDSAGIHIAAATNTKSVCILHGAHFGRFLPYPNLIINPPKVVYNKKNCFGCGLGCCDMSGYTDECQKNIARVGRFLCLEDIDEEQVYSLIE